MRYDSPMAKSSGVVWQPTPEYTTGSHLGQLMSVLALPGYDALYRFSIEHPDRFWLRTLECLGIEWVEKYLAFVDHSKGREWPEWFVGGKLNLCHNAVTRHAERLSANQLALVWEGEDGRTVRLSFAELERRVTQAALAFKKLGVKRGDRIGIYLPMLPETAISALAAARIGAVFVPLFSGFGAAAVATRLRDSGAKLLVTADGFLRRGKPVLMKPIADEAASLVGGLEVVVVRRLRSRAPQQASHAIFWDELVPSMVGECPNEPMGSMDPFMLIYTSGTTGQPKGTVHYHAGFPLKAAQDLAHLFDLRRGEVLFWVTDLGWMMGPWAILGALHLGAAVLLYEGAVDYPEPDRLWGLVERHRVTHLGVSPTLVRALAPHGSAPVRKHDLRRLRIFGSTGEPWNPEPYLWLFHEVGQGRRPIINYSGGTEVSGGILGCTVFRPIKAAGFNTVVPGIEAAVLDETGRPASAGSVGELAVRTPWPGMTKGFWQDPQRYLETYWGRFKGVWVHGDWTLVDKEGHWFILGRSDDTLKVAGKRIGPAELESAAVEHPAVKEAAAIGVPDQAKGEVAVLFVVLKSEFSPSARLAEELTQKVAHLLGKPMRPHRVHFVPDLPKTRNAKVMRRLIRAAYLGEAAGDISSLENPELLAVIRWLALSNGGL